MTRSKNQKVLIGIGLFTAIYSTVWNLSDLIYSHRYFTNQSVLLVLITFAIAFKAKTQKPWYIILSFAALVSILLTSIVFHVLLADGQVSLQGHLSHTIIPIVYLTYFFIYTTAPKLKHLLIGIIHPLLYFTFFLMFGGLLQYYPYDFMDVSMHGLRSVLFTSLGIILPISILIASLLLWLKQRLYVQTKSLSR